MWYKYINRQINKHVPSKALINAKQSEARGSYTGLHGNHSFILVQP